MSQVRMVSQNMYYNSVMNPPPQGKPVQVISSSQRKGEKHPLPEVKQEPPSPFKITTGDSRKNVKPTKRAALEPAAPEATRVFEDTLRKPVHSLGSSTLIIRGMYHRCHSDIMVGAAVSHNPHCLDGLTESCSPAEVDNEVAKPTIRIKASKASKYEQQRPIIQTRQLLVRDETVPKEKVSKVLKYHSLLI